MNILESLDITLLKNTFGQSEKSVFNNEQKTLFNKMMQNSNLDLDSNYEEPNLAKALLGSSLYKNDTNFFDTAILNAIENNNKEALQTVSQLLSISLIRELSGSSLDKKNSYFNSGNDFLEKYTNDSNSKMIEKLQKKLTNIEKNINSIEDKTVKTAYEEEYKLYSKVLEKYKEFQAEDEKVLAQMIQLRKSNPLF